LITIAGHDGQAGILGEARIGERKIAEEEDGAASGFEPADVETIGAEAGGRIVAGGTGGRRHEARIAQA
jgi:hypothetical protein